MLCRQKKTAVVKRAAGMDNTWMNLFLALFWLICAALLLAYEHFMGATRLRLHVRGYSFSYAWFMLVLVLYNLKRWRYERNHRAKQRLLEVARAQSEWNRRRRSTTPSSPPDPNFNFSDEPLPPSNRGIIDQPPSNN
ncbi:MAG: hypothetical protein ACRELG_14235 [Gemmataceae bacterium]